MQNYAQIDDITRYSLQNLFLLAQLLRDHRTL